MHKDEPTQHGPGLGPSTDDRPATARSVVRGLLPVALAPLIAGTCWVVAASLSPWLVPPYLLLMALFLLPPAGRRHDGPSGGVSGHSPVDAPALSGGRGEGADEAGWTSDGPASATSSASAEGSGDGPGTAAVASTTSARGRRGKGRSRKPRAAAEVPEATWIEVAPGKFVRAEASALATGSGPHALVGGRPEVAETTPTPPSEDEPSRPGSAEAPGSSVASRETSDAPGAEAEPGPGSIVFTPPEDAGPATSIEIEANPELAPLVLDEGPSTADGTKPQVAGPFAAEVRADPELDLDGVDARDRAARTLPTREIDPFAATDRAESLPVAGPSSPFTGGDVPAAPATLGELEARAMLPEASAAGPLVDERDAGASAPRGRGQAEEIREFATVEGDPPPGPGVFAEPGRSEVTPEAADATRWGSAGWADLPGGLASETPERQDEPNPDLALESLDLADDDDHDRSDPSPEEDDQPVASDGPSWWPRPWSKARRTRPGFRAQANPPAMPPRHLGRSREPARAPADPRRPSRRGLSRPRQGSRTFPPRSPPRGRSARGR